MALGVCARCHSEVRDAFDHAAVCFTVDELARLEARVLVQHALASSELPARLLLEHHVLGCLFEELARRHGLSARQINVALVAARQRLRHRLGAAGRQALRDLGR